MLESVLMVLVLLWLFATLGISGAITMNVKEENYKTGCLIALKDFLIKLFNGKNWFGIVLSIIVLIISIPAMLLILMVQILFYVLIGIRYVWKLRDMLDKAGIPYLCENQTIERYKISYIQSIYPSTVNHM